jgi:hypothetical protein
LIAGIIAAASVAAGGLEQTYALDQEDNQNDVTLLRV